MIQKTCFICNGPKDKDVEICPECSKVWVKNPVGMNIVTGKPLTVSDGMTWGRRADDLVAAAQVLIAEWKEAHTIYFDGLPKAEDSGMTMVRLTPDQMVAERKLHIIAIAEMLIGMAFECAAKGIIIDTEDSIVDNKQRWDALTRGHNLSRYFDQTPIGKTLSSTERNLLNRLQEAIEWRGRYPGSKKEPDVYMQLSSDKEFEGWEDLWRRLCNHYKYKAIEPLD